MRFSNTTGGKKTLSLENIFRTNEITLKCLKTAKSLPQKFHCRFERASDLGPLVQLFSWNDEIDVSLYLGDIDFSNQKAQLKLFNNLERFPASGVFIVTENQNRKSMSFSLESDNMIVGTIIDFTEDSNGISPFKIFGMTVHENNKNMEIFYTTPQEGQECFKLATSLVEKYS